MNDRTLKAIAGLIKHLENMDGDELKSHMEPKAVEIEIEKPMDGEMPKDGPMDKLMAKAGEESEAPPMPEQVDDDEEMDDEDFEEMMKL